MPDGWTVRRSPLANVLPSADLQWLPAESERGLVSVIIPTYNRQQLLIDAVGSVLEQTYRPIELLIVDDASNDKTADVVGAWKEETSGDGRFSVVYLRQAVNRGAPAARNRGARESRGEFLVFSDSDDMLAPECVSLKVRRMTAEGAQLCEGSWKSLSPNARVYTCQSHSSDLLLDFLRGQVAGATPCWMIRRDLLREIGPWDEELVCYQDIDLTFRLLASRPTICFEPRAIALVRQERDGRVTHMRATEQGYLSVLKSHRKRWHTLKEQHAQEQYLLPEARQLMHFAVLAHARKYSSIGQEFESLALDLWPEVITSYTGLSRVLLAVGGARLYGLLMRMRRHLRGRWENQTDKW